MQPPFVSVEHGLKLSYAERGESSDLAVVLLLGPTLAGDSRLGEFVDSVVASLDDPIDPELVRSFMVDTSSDQVAPDVLDDLVSESMKVPARAWQETFGELVRYDGLADLGRITAPTLLI